jgi:hypothetical protein
MARPSEKRPGGIASLYEGLVDLVEEVVELADATPEAVGDTVRSTIAYGELITGGAQEYVQRFHGVTVPEYGVEGGKIMKLATAIGTPVREYLNNSHSNRANNIPAKRRALKDFLLSNPGTLLKGQFDIASHGDTMTISRDGRSILAVSKAQVSTCFYGKGTPEMLAKTIELLGIWVVYSREIRKIDAKKLRVKWTDKEGKQHDEKLDVAIDDLPTMVDSYLGVDCNGFTGRYWKAKYPWLEVDPGNTEESYVQDETHLRKTLAEIRVDDCAVLNNGGFHHVAIVSQVLTRTADELRVMLSESRSAELEHGGPQSNIWVVRPKFDVKKKPIESKFKIDGRPGETFINFTAPHSLPQRKPKGDSKK